MKTISISKDFKQKTSKAILSIVFFIVIYILMMLLAIGLTIALGYGAIMLIATKATIVTLGLGIGMASIGFILLLFMVKFIFAEYKTDLSHMVEIFEEDEHKLFAFIKDITKEIGTPFPKKIYISHEVNASVFYDSSFWSMFFPIKKNLHIGLGLMNSITTDEFKAIMAHEFGHFSQRSMKVGSYVYNVNRIIHNMLYDNESYDKMLGKWSSMNGYFSFFTLIGIKIINGIQWVLRKVYNVVNLNYMSLSREMEFHADEVAANVAGSKSVATSLVRLEFASFALDDVLNHYGSKINDNLKPDNIFPQQLFVLGFLGKKYNLPFENGLPQATLATNSIFNKSKLELNDQWASHPENKDRIKRVEDLDIEIKDKNNNLSMSLFLNTENIQKRITSNMFSTVEYTLQPVNHTLEEFKDEYMENDSKSSFHKKFNNYYNPINPATFDPDTIEISTDTEISEDILFNQESVDAVYNSLGIENDINTLNHIAGGLTVIKSFDYDGQKYNMADAAGLIKKLELELKNVRARVKRNNEKIFSYYYSVAKENGNGIEYKTKYIQYKDNNTKFLANLDFINDLYNATQFTQESTAFEVINSKMQDVYDKETELKSKIKEILDRSRSQEIILPELNDTFNKYISQQWTYFEDKSYNEEALQLLFRSIDGYSYIIREFDFKLKKDLLDFQASLTNSTVLN